VIPQGLVDDGALKNQAASVAVRQMVAGQTPGAHLRGFCSLLSPATEGAQEHFVIQVLTWLAELPDPLPGGFCKEF
jgi:hypothetical protein